MKQTNLYSILAILAVGFTSVSAQEPVKVIDCPADQPRELRVPRAEIVLSDTGETAFKINANETWRRTSVEVKRGESIEISASGKIRWAQDGTAWTIVSADGTVPPRLKQFPYPEAGIGSLVLRIGKGVYPAGTSVTIVAEDDGFIELMINDDVLGDNSGHFLVKLNIARY